MTEIIKLYEKREPAKDGFCMTDTATAILWLLKHCHDAGEIGLIIGAPGVGKTAALEHYAKTAGDPIDVGDRYLFTASEACRRLRPAMLRLHEFIVGYYVDYRSTNELLRSIDAEIAARSDYDEDGRATRRPLIIVDEAGYLDDQPLDLLRHIHDITQCGVVLCGNRDFRKRLSGTVGTAQFTQLSSRIGPKLVLDAPMDSDVAALCDHFGIGNATARAYLDQLAERERGLRGVVRLIRAARDHFTDGRAIGCTDLERAHAMLGGKL